MKIRNVKHEFFLTNKKLSPFYFLSLMLFYTFSASLCYIAIKAGLQYSPPLRFAGLRTFIGGFSLILLLILLKKPVLPRRKLIKWISPVAFLSTTITFGFMFSSPEFTGAGIASVLGNAQPLIIIVFASLFLNEKITAVKIITLILGLTGILFISAQALITENQGALLGVMFAFGTSTGAALTAVLLKRLSPESDLISFTGWQLIVGSLPLLAISFILESGTNISWSSFFVFLLLLLALLGTALNTIIWFWLLQKYEAGKLSLFLFLIPVFGLLFAFIAFGESLQSFEIIGIIIVLSAIGLSVIKEYQLKNTV